MTLSTIFINYFKSELRENQQHKKEIIFYLNCKLSYLQAISSKTVAEWRGPLRLGWVIRRGV